MERAAVAQTMALEGQAVHPLPTDRADAIDDLIRTGQLHWGSTAAAVKLETLMGRPGTASAVAGIRAQMDAQDRAAHVADDADGDTG